VEATRKTAERELQTLYQQDREHLKELEHNKDYLLESRVGMAQV
jgi:hypothetical protein